MKWIEAIQLEQWADTIGSRIALSEIVCSLVRASAPDAVSFRFPTGDSAQLPDYDGQLIATGFPPYVPDGKSVWEFGTAKNSLKKADEDFNTRSKNPGGIDPKENTFVFVTPRRWVHTDKSKKGWEDEKRTLGIWKGVQLIDAVDLEEWLYRSPAVSANVARSVLPLIPQNGARSTAEFWDEYSSRFAPPLTEDVLLAGRKEQALQLLRQIAEEPSQHLWQADSTEETIAFTVAAIRKAEPDVFKYLESRTMVIDTEEAGRFLVLQSHLIFLPRAGLTVAGLLSRQHATVIAIGRDAPNRKEGTVLNRTPVEVFAEALKTMQFSDERAVQLARLSGSSVTILARRIPSAAAMKPDWAGVRSLIPALLAGAWDANCEFDRKAIASIAGSSEYELYEDSVRNHVHIQDSPLEVEGSVWAIRAPVDAFAYLAPQIGGNDLKRMADLAKTVFSEDDPSLDLPLDERPYAGLQGKTFKYSEWLRDGLAKTVLLMAALHTELRLTVSGLAPQEFVDSLIASLPGLAENCRRIASLHSELPQLMEAAPRPLLRALEQMLQGDAGLLKPLFQDHEGGLLLGSSPHTGLLWALEILAWDPEYLQQATMMLAKLARIDPGGKYTNRPINSLGEIFLPWHPSTNATLAQRLVALDQILKQESEVGWSLLVQLLPKSHSVSSSTAKPRYRESGSSKAETLTYGIVAKTYQEVITRALKLAGKSPQRWTKLISHLSTFAPDSREEVLNLLLLFATEASADDRKAVWDVLRKEVNRNKAFQNAAWSIKGEFLTRLEEIVERLQPEDANSRIEWLFNEHHPDLPGTPGIASTESILDARRAAVEPLFKQGGTMAVFELARRVKLPAYVAVALVPLIEAVKSVEQLVEAAVGPENPDMFAVAISGESRRKFGTAWLDSLKKLFGGGRITATQAALLISHWPDDRSTWDFASALGDEVEQHYWRTKVAWPLQGDSEQLEFAAKKYREVGRALHGIKALDLVADQLSAKTIFALLDSAVIEMNESPSGVPGGIIFDIENLFDSLQKREDVDLMETARREYVYLPLFSHRERKLVIHQLLSVSPELFVELICGAYRRASGPSREVSKEERERAQASYRVLADFDVVPGASNHDINIAELKKWIAKARQLAYDSDRSIIADEKIGQVLAHAEADADGAWPHAAIRNVLEELASADVERGISIERFNMRGTWTKEPYEGGGQERALAAQCREWSKATQNWPRTSALLEQIAQEWEQHGGREDERARKDVMRFS